MGPNVESLSVTVWKVKVICTRFVTEELMQSRESLNIYIEGRAKSILVVGYRRYTKYLLPDANDYFYQMNALPKTNLKTDQNTNIIPLLRQRKVPVLP